MYRKKKNGQKESINDHNYFKGHNCCLPADKLTAYDITLQGWRKIYFNLISVKADDIRAINLYRSYAALCAQKYKHYNDFFWTLHPYSRLRLWFEFAFVIIYILYPIFLALHYTETHMGSECPFEILKQWCHTIFILQVIINFFTGYVTGKSSKITVLNLKKICCRYLKTWFLVDFLAAVGFLPFLLETHPYLTLFNVIKLLQLPKLHFYTNNCMTVLRLSRARPWFESSTSGPRPKPCVTAEYLRKYKQRGHGKSGTCCMMLTFLDAKRTSAKEDAFVKIIIEICVALFLYLSWNIYFQFAVEYLVEMDYNPINPRNCSWLAMGKLWNETVTVKLLYSLDRSVVMLTSNTNMNIVQQKNCFGTFLVLGWLISKILVYHLTLRYVIVQIGYESARSNYHIMKTQVETYMTQKKFPPRLKKKILKFYAVRFQRNYMAETLILNCLSGQLREDIMMHTSRQLVGELPVLQNLPRPLLMQISFKMRLVIFIAGDVIFKINTVGDCLFFVDKGTVAIYSESGKEISHVDDGDFFGELTLVMKHGFRIVTAIAVTNCELYRLDKDDFDTTIAYHPTLYEYFKKNAISRFEKTCVLDAHHRAELRSADDKRASSSP